MKRPLSLTIIGWLSILAGVVCFLFLVFVGLYADSGSSTVSWFHRFSGSGLFISGTVAALAGGVGVLTGFRWGCWLILGGLVLLLAEFRDQGTGVFVFHGLLLVIFGYFLFRPKANAYFNGDQGMT